MRYTTEVAIFEKVTRYNPEAEDTTGGSPSVSSTGLKMTPPPRPSAPERVPPKKPSDRSVIALYLSRITSLLTRLI